MATPPKVLIKRTDIPGRPPTGLLPGELAIEMATPTRLWVGVPANLDASEKKLLIDTAQVGGAYVGEMPPLFPGQGDFWFESDTGVLWLRYDDGTSTQWIQVNGGGGSSGGGGAGVWIGEAPPDLAEPGALWYESDTGIFSIYYDDGNTRQWVQVNGISMAGGGGGGTVDAYTKGESDARFVNLDGDAMTGHLGLPINPAANQAVRRDYVESAVTTVGNGKVSKTGDTMTGGLTINAAGAGIVLNKTASGQSSAIYGSLNAQNRWIVQIGDNAAESGEAGSNFLIQRYSNAGLPTAVLQIQRVNGNATFYSYLTAQGGLRSNAELTVVNGINRWQTDGSLVVSVAGYQPGGGMWGDSSDARIKTVNGNYEHGLAEIKQIQPVRYTFNNNDQVRTTRAEEEYVHPHQDVAGKEFIGVVAQDIEGVLPETVSQRAAIIDGQPVTDMRMFDGSPLVYALINAVKELSARIEALEAAAAPATAGKA